MIATAARYCLAKRREEKRREEKRSFSVLASGPYEDSPPHHLHNRAAYLRFATARLDDRLTHNSLPRTAQLKPATQPQTARAVGVNAWTA